VVLVVVLELGLDKIKADIGNIMHITMVGLLLEKHRQKPPMPQQEQKAPTLRPLPRD
jgi:hypothetical protein